MTKLRIVFICILLVISHVLIHAQNTRLVLGTNQSFHIDSTTQQEFSIATSSTNNAAVDSLDPLSASTSYFISSSFLIGVQFWEELELDFLFGFSNSTYTLTTNKATNSLLYKQTNGAHSEVDLRYYFRFQSFLSLYINGGFGVRMNIHTIARHAKQSSDFIFPIAAFRTTDDSLKEVIDITFEPYVPFGGGITFRIGEYDYSRFSLGYLGRFYITQMADKFGFVDSSASLQSVDLKTPILTHGVSIEYAYVF